MTHAKPPSDLPVVISASTLSLWVTSLLEGWGYRSADAVYIARSLVDSDLRGLQSHGVMRLSAYRARVAAGLVRPEAQPVVTKQRATAQVDADGCAGQLAARAAIDAVTGLSGEYGVACAAVRGSAHFGAAGFFSRELAASGKVGFVLSNSEPVVVPHGGREPLLGTNPFSFAAPTRDEPITLDMATSTSAMGKILVARASGSRIPADWGVDSSGLATTDPEAVVALLPASGPKGYGLAFLVEILCGVLTGAAVASEVGNMYTDFAKSQDVGHWIMAIDIDHFTDLGQFESRMQSLIDAARAIAPAPGFGAVQVPGEPEAVTARSRRTDGIEIPLSTVRELSVLGREVAVDFPGEQK